MREVLKGKDYGKKDGKIKKEYVKPSVEIVELRVDERISNDCKNFGDGQGSPCYPVVYTSALS